MRYKYLLTTCLLATLCAPAYSQISSDLVGSCEIGQAEAYLDVGNVRARLFNSGNLFWRGSPYIYTVPIGGNANTTFVDDFWFGGMVDGDVRVAGGVYGPWEFWPGPVPDDGSTPSDCSPYDKFWTIEADKDLLSTLHTDFPSQSVIDWPVELGARYVEVDNIPGYTPYTGDRPYMLGDQMHWWIMNDVGNSHDYFGSKPAGIEVRVTAFAFKSNTFLGNSTFYRYEVTNRSTRPILGAYAGRFADVDLGNFSDDYMGSDSTLSLMYFYNADNDDEGGGGYGTPPPAFGLTLIEASHSRGLFPSDVDPQIKPRFSSITGPFKGRAPRTPESLMNVLSGRWEDGHPITVGGDGRDLNNPVTRFIFSGDPVTKSFWSQMNADGLGTAIAPSDKRMTASYGPFDMEVGDTVTFTYAYVWARGTDHLDSVTELKKVTAIIRKVATALLSPKYATPRFIDGNPPEKPGYAFWLSPPWPNPSSGRTTMEYSISQDGPVSIDLYDSLSRYVANIESTAVEAGRYLANFNTGDLASGVYTIRLVSLHHVASKRLVIL